MSIDIGSPAPTFTLPSDGGGTVDLAALKGRNIILYFYPKDDTPGCTTEACAFQEAQPDFSAADAVVIGVSRDSAASHDKFKQKYGLAFALASDAEGQVCEAYGVWVEKTNYGKKYMGIERSTFLIDAAGIVRKIWRKVSVKDHAAEVLAALKSL
jgi:peroxiredoxin Q/BCP